ncbi:hypothetical protein Lal_00023931 [Lupinus albus]|nr:hypothetical protein Lal_00023931 [Lupinus albus]
MSRRFLLRVLVGYINHSLASSHQIKLSEELVLDSYNGDRSVVHLEQIAKRFSQRSLPLHLLRKFQDMFVLREFPCLLRFGIGLLV